MPVYEGWCAKCEIAADYLRAVADRHDTPTCVSCGDKMTQAIFTAAKGFVRGRFDPFKSPVDGTIIASQRDMDEHNRRNNVVNMADGYSEDAIKTGNFSKKEQKLDAKELKQDIHDAIQAVKSGYTPLIGEAHD